MKLLYFARTAGLSFINSVFERSILGSAEKHYLTEFAALKDKLAPCHYLINSDKKKQGIKRNILKKNEIADVIKRDRYLSVIPKDRAVNMAENAIAFIDNVFERVNPDVAVVKDLDTYTNDIFLRIARQRNVLNFHMVIGVKGTMKFYLYNYPYERKAPYDGFDLYAFMEQKSGNVYRKLPKDNLFLRLKNLYSGLLHFYRYRLKTSEDIRNKNTHILYRKKDVFVRPRFNLRDLRGGYYADLNDVPENKKPLVFISLHYYPEATINYFTPDNSLIMHDEVVLDILSRYEGKYLFVVKEHPEMFNKRKINFYDKIKQFKKTILLHPYIPSSEVLKKTDYVISWAGSIGWEAPFYNTIPLNVIKPYFHVEGFSNYFNDYDDLMENLGKKIEKMSFNIEKYKQGLNDRFKRISWKGIPFAPYNSEDNINDLAHSVNQFLEEQSIYESLIKN